MIINFLNSHNSYSKLYLVNMIQLEVKKHNTSIGPQLESTEIGTDENTARISNKLNLGI